MFFIFTPTWGNDPICRAYVSNGLVQPPTRICRGCAIYCFKHYTPSEKKKTNMAHLAISTINEDVFPIFAWIFQCYGDATSNQAVASCIAPGDHGSTFAGEGSTTNGSPGKIPCFGIVER